MTVTEMNVCFEAALLQRSSSERQGMQDAPGACWSPREKLLVPSVEIWEYETSC